MPVARADSNVTTKIFWFTPLLLAVACSGSEDIDFFEPNGSGGSATGGTATGGSAGSDTGGTTTGGSATGGTSGKGTGGSGSEATGGSGAETGGTGAEGGTNPTGGTSQGGDAGGGAGPTGGSAGEPTGGSAGMGMSGMGGAGMGGAGMGGAGMGGAGMGGGGGKGGKGGCVPTVPSAELCDGVDNNCMNGADEGSACPDNCTGATLQGHYYTFCSFENASGMGTRQRTWLQAQDFCSMRNMVLIAIDSAEENDFVRAWITRMQLQDQVWMGANDRDPAIGLGNEGEWIWNSGNNAIQFWQGNENGSAVMNRYEDWSAGEPNNENNEDCGALSFNHEYHWDDRACTNMYANFVCEALIPVAGN